MINVAVSQHFLEEKQHVCSLDAEAYHLGTNEKKVRRNRFLSAACALEMEKQQWRSIERSLASAATANQLRLLSYLEFVTYDGVDL